MKYEIVTKFCQKERGRVKVSTRVMPLSFQEERQQVLMHSCEIGTDLIDYPIDSSFHCMLHGGATKWKSVSGYVIVCSTHTFF